LWRPGLFVFMPLPTPNDGEERQSFISRCMSAVKDEFEDKKQRVAVCFGQWKKGTKEARAKRLAGEIVCKNEDQRLVFGWASVIEENGQPVVDKQNDIITAEELEKGAYDFALHARIGGEMHRKEAGRLVESMVFTLEKQQALGIDLGKVGWWVGFQVSSDDAWQKVKSGELKAFSIGGKAGREDIAAA
jgi:hypothetical protein